MGLGNIILDPAEVAIEGRTELPLEGAGLSIYYEGLDFGDQEIRTFMAEGLFGSTPIDHDWPLRTIKIPLIVRAYGTETFDDIRAKLEAKIARINEDGGGWLKRILPSGRHIFADLVEAKLHLSASWLAENRNIDREATLELQALPDFYGDEITESTFEGTGDAAQTLKVKGTLPARITSLKVEDKSGLDQYGLGFHLRCRNYSSASTAAWAYEAEALTPLDIAAEVALSGASGGNAIRHNNLGTEWTPVLSTNLKAGTYLTHKGLYDVWVRVYTTSATLPWLRFVWDVGDIVAPSENTQIQIPGLKGFYLVNLGQIMLRSVPFGEHRWQGVIQARGETGGENVYIDRLRLFCGDEASGILSGTPASVTPVAASYLVRDEYLQSPGAATGKTAAIGGVYAKVTNSDTTDYEVDESQRLKRAAISDTGTIGTLSLKGCGLGTPVEATSLTGLFDFAVEGTLSSGFKIGWIVSYVNNTNFVVAYLTFNPTPKGLNIPVQLNIVRADGTNLGKVASPHGLTTLTNPKGSIMVVVRGNRLHAFTAGEGEDLAEALNVEDSMIGAKGKVYVYDENSSATAANRWYDNLSMWVPQNDPVIYGSKSLRITSSGMYRASEDGKSSGSVAYPGSDLPRLPISGAEERLVEIAIKPSRGDFATIPDGGLDKSVSQLSYRPCFAEVPSS